MAIRDKSKNINEDLERPYLEIGQRLKKWRTENNMLQEDVANEVFTKKQIYWAESGRRSPSIELLVYLKSRFGLSIDWIITGQE